MLVTSIFSFSHNVFKRLFFFMEVGYHIGLRGKGLNICIMRAITSYKYNITIFDIVISNHRFLILLNSSYVLHDHVTIFFLDGCRNGRLVYWGFIFT